MWWVYICLKKTRARNLTCMTKLTHPIDITHQHNFQKRVRQKVRISGASQFLKASEKQIKTIQSILYLKHLSMLVPRLK